jgi:hypothetical protein
MPHPTGHARRQPAERLVHPDGAAPGTVAFTGSEAQTFELRRFKRPRLLAYWTRLLDPATAAEGPVTAATTAPVGGRQRTAEALVEGLRTHALYWTDLVLEAGQWVALVNHPVFAGPARRQAREEYWLHLALNSLLIVVLAGLYGWLSFG